MRLFLLEDAEYFFLTHNEEFLAIDLDLGSRVLAEQDAVAGLYIQGEHLTLVVRLAFTDGDNLTLLWLFLGGVRDDDAAPNRFALFHAPYKNAVVKWREAGSYGCCCRCHCVTSPSHEGLPRGDYD